MKKEVTVFDPLIFRHYQSLAVAVLKQYQKDKERETKRLLTAKENLMKRIKTGKSQGLVQRWTIESAWESWEQSLRNFDSFCYFENTEIFQFYKEIAEIQLNHGGARIVLSNWGKRNGYMFGM